jgi:hypothetical protein
MAQLYIQALGCILVVSHDSQGYGGDIGTRLLIETVKVTLRLAVYRQPVRLGVKPLETNDQIFFQLNSCGNSPYVTSSPTRRWVYHL